MSTNSEGEGDSGPTKDKSETSLLGVLIASEINLARTFAVVARTAYERGDRDSGDTARAKADEWVSTIAQLVAELSDSERQWFSSDLDNLRQSIEEL
jgi:hypothetical protein